MRARRSAVAVVVGALAVSGCAGGSPAPPAPARGDQDVPRFTTVLRLDFEDIGAGALAPGSVPVGSVGDRPAAVRLVASGGGRVWPARAAAGGSAARFPAFDARAPRTAVLTVAVAGREPGLDPGLRDFAFGLDFALDAQSEGSRFDNGNNLVQRGLFRDEGQYKLQVEKGRVSCRIAGDAGAVVVTSEVPVEPGEWYRAACSRLGDVVALRLGPVGARGRRVVASGATGAVRLPTGTPLVVGGKASARGEPMPDDSDQFNGRLDNVHLEVGPAL